MTHTYSHLEDFSEDIIAKAQDGLRITNRELADQGGIDLGSVKALKNGEIEEPALQSVANVLGLSPARLIVAAKKEWLPRTISLGGLEMFTSQFRSMTVNAFLIASSDGRAVLFDTGVDPDAILDHLARAQLKLDAIVLTHGHPDHVAGLDAILQGHSHCPVFAHPAEKIPGSHPVEWNSSFRAGPLALRCLSTPGHTPGGSSFLIEGRDPPICVIGDALFAGSVGGCAADYQNALRSIRKNLLTLPPETILCPGHGPMTTVGEERSHNPFFPE